MQIRDGLHVFGASAARAQLADLLVALARLPRGDGAAAGIADPRARRRSRRSASIRLTRRARRGLERTRGRRRWPAAAPGAAPATRSSGSKRWRAISSPAMRSAEPRWTRTRAVLDWIDARSAPGDRGLRRGRDRRAARRARRPLRARRARRARRRAAGPKCCRPGAISISLDTRAVPTPAAWQLGWKSAALLVERHRAGARRLSRRASRSRPGARPICAPAATISPRRWR